MSLRRGCGKHDLDNIQGDPFPPSRLVLHDHPQLYYKACRSSSEDVLSCVTDSRRPLVLLLAPGDPHSLLYTLYRNFDPEFRGRFEGATFLVNENWSLLQARDILIFYLCLQMPSRVESHEGLHLCATIWATLFSTTLMPDHLEVLKNAVSVLLRFSSSLEDWDSPRNQMRKIVKFRNEETLRAVGRHWRRWFRGHPDQVPNFKTMMEGRSNFLSRQHLMNIVDVVTKFPHFCLPHLIGLSADLYSEKTQQLMKLDFVNFLSTGTTFAEEVLHLPIDKQVGMATNFTFYDGTEHTFNNSPFYGRIPFLAFFHAFLFSPSGCRRGNVARTLTDKLPVPDHQFEEQPLLSNSVQQLFLWLAASSRALKKSAASDSPNITFVFECCDPLRLLLQLQVKEDDYHRVLGQPPVFDLIHTFELFDVISPPDIVYNSMPVLQPNHFMIAVAVDFHTFGHTHELYLGTIFGIHPQIFPILYGMRCVGVEGTDSDGTLARQTAWELDPSYKQRDIRTLVFQRIKTTPYLLSNIKQFECAPQGLLSSVHSTIFQFPSNLYSVSMGCGTVVSAIFAFMIQLEVSVNVKSWEFWEPFANLIRKEVNIKYMHHNLQAAFFLHGLHIHLTVDRKSCPMCNGRPISSYVSMYTVKIKDPSLYVCVTLALFINNEGVGSTALPDLKKTHMTQAAAVRTDDRNNHYIDFYFPKEFADEKENYWLTVVKFSDASMLGTKVGVPSVFRRVAMRELVVNGSQYCFRGLPRRQRPQHSNFGRMERHNGDCVGIHSEIDVCHHLSYLLKANAIAVKSDFPGQKQIRLSIRDQYKFDIFYPYPIDFKMLVVEFYCETDVVIIDAPRDCYTFVNHDPMFVVTPTNRLFLPAAPVVPPRPAVRDYLTLQMSLTENDALRSKKPVKIQPLVHLKPVLKDLFSLASTQCRFLNIKSTNDDVLPPKLQGMIVIHDEVVDLETRSPALDVSYCFLDKDEKGEELLITWRRLASEHLARTFIVPEKHLEHVKEMFTYFTKRTSPIYTDNNRTTLCRIKILRKNNVESYFSRAVIFPFYASPDKQVRKPFSVKKEGPSDEAEVRKTAKTVAELMSQRPGVVHHGYLDRVERDRIKAASYMSASAATTSAESNDSMVDVFKFIKGVEIIGGKAYVRLVSDDEQQRQPSAAPEPTRTETIDIRAKPQAELQKEKLKQKLRKKVKDKDKMKTRSGEGSATEVKETEKPAKKEVSKTTGNPKSSNTGKRTTSETVVNKTTTRNDKKNEKKPSPSVGEKSKSIATKESLKKPDDEGKGEKTAVHNGSQGAEPPSKPHPRSSGKLGGKTKGKCTNCGQSSDHMKKCARCGGPRYCCRDCQKQHWKKHKPDCITDEKVKETDGNGKNAEKTTPTSEEKSTGSQEKEEEEEEKEATNPTEERVIEASCFTCGRHSETLKRCKCIKAIYCDVECQRKDWPHHKLTCTAVPQKK